MTAVKERKKVTVPGIVKRKGGKKISMVTAYDYSFAVMLDHAGTDILLVGDSLGMVCQGRESTLPVTLDEMIYHTRAVVRGAEKALVVADLPFMSYHLSVEDTLKNAGRVIKETGAAAIKLEGGIEQQKKVGALVAAGIPVMGHVGLLPQSVHALGGFKVQGKTEQDAERIVRDAIALENAGAFSVVIEGVPAAVGKKVTAAINIPTIGIGAGPDCDGQVLVCYDLLGLTSNLKPKFVKTYANFFQDGINAVATYIAEVEKGVFPSEQHSFGTKKAEPKTESRPGYGPTA